MEFYVDKVRRMATVWCSNAEQNNPEALKKLQSFMDDCKSKKIYVCLLNSGKGDLKENTKELISYNYNNSINQRKDNSYDAR